jgi:hypothetical protein
LAVLTLSTSYDNNFPTVLPFDGAQGTYGSLTTTGAVRIDNLKMRVFHIASIATGEIWTSGIHGVVKCATGQNAKLIKVAYDETNGTGDFLFTVSAGPAVDVELFVFSPN